MRHELNGSLANPELPNPEIDTNIYAHGIRNTLKLLQHGGVHGQVAYGAYIARLAQAGRTPIEQSFAAASSPGIREEMICNHLLVDSLGLLSNNWLLDRNKGFFCVDDPVTGEPVHRKEVTYAYCEAKLPLIDSIDHFLLHKRHSDFNPSKSFATYNQLMSVAERSMGVLFARSNHGIDKIFARSALSGVLGERKTLYGLSSLNLEPCFASAEQDVHKGYDMSFIESSMSRHPRNIKVQVKTIFNHHGLEVALEGHDRLRITLPLGGDSVDAFYFSSNELDYLDRRIRHLIHPSRRLGKVSLGKAEPLPA